MKKSKRLVSVLLALVMIVSVASVFAAPASAATVGEYINGRHVLLSYFLKPVLSPRINKLRRKRRSRNILKNYIDGCCFQDSDNRFCKPLNSFRS